MEKLNQAEQGLDPNSSSHFPGECPSQKAAVCPALVFHRNSILELRILIFFLNLKFCQTVSVKVAKKSFSFNKLLSSSGTTFH